MPSKHAKSKISPATVKTIIFVVYPQIKLLDLAGPLQVFNDTRIKDNKPAYRTVVASVDGALVQTDAGLSLNCESLADWNRRQIDTLIIVGGPGVYDALDDSRLVTNITRLAAKSRRVASVCVGAFLLAAAGPLNGRRATTHWESANKFATDFPDVHVEVNPIYIKDDNVWTSAGVTAGIDMALAMLSEDHGRTIALNVARSLVAFLVRPGGQSQFSETLELQSNDSNAKFDSLHQWILANLEKDLRVENLAYQANMSPRNFSRMYSLTTGRTPAKAVEAIRVEAAKRLLENGKLSVSVIAQRCGFRDDERMRRSFIRVIKVPPSHYLKTVSHVGE